MRAKPLLVSMLLLSMAMLACGCASPLRPTAWDGPVSPESVAAVPDALRQSLVRREYEASANRIGLQAPNRAHELRSYFEPTQVRVTNRNANAAQLVSLSLERIGRTSSGSAVGAGVVLHRGSRVEIARPALALVEWFDNSPDGLEQGFTLARRPPGGGALLFDLHVSDASVSRFGNELAFRSAAGRVLRYGRLHAEDSAGRTLSSHFELAAGGFRIAVDDGEAVYPIVVDPLLTASFESELESNQPGAEFGESVAAAGDVNGDGFADVIVGADSFDAGEEDEGAAFVFLGSAAGVADPGNPINAQAVIEGNLQQARLGRSVSGAGDVNGDGFSDVIVGAPLWTSGAGEAEEGAAFVYYGSAAGVDTTSFDLIQSNEADAQLGTSVRSAGDVNGDGYADVIVGAPGARSAGGSAFVFHGGPAGIGDQTASTSDTRIDSSQLGVQFGQGVSGAGDVNGDGFDDVIVGAHLYTDPQTNEGAAFVFHGSPQGIVQVSEMTADASIFGNQTEARLGFSVASAGDWNRDGFDDVIVGAERLGPVLFEEGAAFIQFGGPSGVVGTNRVTIQSFQDEARLGRIVDSAGDVNGDGFADVIVGAHLYDAGETDEGAAFVFLGREVSAPLTLVPADAHAQLEADQADAQFGFSVAGAGDVNGDGFDDVIAGAVFMDTPQVDEGAAFVYHGGGAGIADGEPTTADVQLEANQADAGFGVGVASAGDVNGDGFSDVIVGAPDYDSGEADEGAAFIFHGSASGIASGGPGVAQTQLESDQADARFGQSVAGAGDVNGDGYADVIVGAPLFDAGELDEGAAFVFLGSPFGISDGDAGSADAGLESDQPGAHMGDDVAGAGDVNGDGFADVVVGAGDFDAGEEDEGAAFVFLGSLTGIDDTNAAGAHARFESDDDFARMGRSVDGAGDVNGDGYADVIVAAQGYSNPESGEGALFVFHGSPNGMTPGGPGAADTVIESDASLGFFAASVSAAGDVNGDGFGDVAGSSTGGSSVSGGYVFLGSPTGVPSGNLSSAQVRLDLGNGLISNAGDINGDGFGDIVYGTQGSQAFLYLGSEVGIPDGSIDAAHAFIDKDPDQFAGTFRRVAAAGDVNGDGFADVIVGDPIYENVENDEGGAFVFHGSAGGPAITPQQLRGDGSGTPVQPGGSSNTTDSFEVQLVASGRGRSNERVKLAIETCPVGSDFGDTSCVFDESDTWVALNGSPTLEETISGLDPGTVYRWRARMLYAPFHVTEPGITAPPVPPAGPWRRVEGQATEGDVRTVPEPAWANTTAVLLLAGLARRRKLRPTPQA